LEKVISRRLNTNVIGYGSAEDKIIDKEHIFQYVSPKDLKSFGLIPELVGRLPILGYLEPG
jgi:ATP-dependent Clp protease ATP-binding subunit ClpX